MRVANVKNIMLAMLLCLTARAFGVSVIDTKTFTVSDGHTDQFYGKNWSVKSAADGSQYLSLDYSNKNSNSTSNIRSLAYGIEMTQAGSYTISFDSKISDYDSQFGYWQVYLADSGENSRWTAARKWTAEFAKTDILINGDIPDNDGLWYSNEITFNITDSQFKNWDQLVFTFSGSRQSNQVVNIKNFSMGVTPTPGGVPEPLTILSIFAASGGLGVYLRKRIQTQK